MIVFDGMQRALEKEALLHTLVSQLSQTPNIAAVFFSEDAGSRLYTRLKKETAARLGIGYQPHEFSVHSLTSDVIKTITELNSDPSITGIIIQKPTRHIWQDNQEPGSTGTYIEWWTELVSSIDLHKDVDGLHPYTIAAVADGTWKEKGLVLPATCQAVIEILAEYCSHIENKKPESRLTELSLSCLENKKIIILGKSDLIGKPLYYYLHNFGYDVEMIGSAELKERVVAGKALTDADVVVSATGRHNLITGDMLKEGVVVIDVGEPKGDIAFESVAQKASFITPVPGGVGPMTVVSLMENGIRLVHGK